MIAGFFVYGDRQITQYFAVPPALIIIVQLVVGLAPEILESF